MKAIPAGTLGNMAADGRRLPFLFRRAFVCLCFLCAPVLTRAALVNSHDAGWLTSDIAGFASDAAMTFMTAFLYMLIASRSRIAGSVIIIVWCAFHCANFEHVSANGGIVSLADIGYLFDPTFFFGSATAVSNKPLIITVALMSFSPLLIRAPRPRVLSLLLVSVSAAGLLSVRPLFSTFMDPRWRRCNALHANAEDLFSSTIRLSAPKQAVMTKIPFDSLWRKDMSGVPVVPRGEKPDNVLLVIMEGCCGGMLPSLARAQGINSPIIMPRLDSIARRNLLYENFITHQRQTNRGEFAILSGTLPKLNSSTPKMTEYVTTGRSSAPQKDRFLPAFLAVHGYQTTYVQAAPLSFMLKDAFMPLAGFNCSYGNDWFKRHYASGYWGIDDKAFFEQAFGLIRAGRNASKPWFVTLLTVGTHHPVTIPETYGDPSHEDQRVRAYRYLDEAVSGFIDSLSGAGILENTLVIITCDESQGITCSRGATVNEQLCQQWGVCVVLHPRLAAPMRVTERFASSDIALSVLDYLGLPADSSAFGGRSMFRRYREGRDIYFANTYCNTVGRFTGDDFLDVCAGNLRYGERYPVDGGRLFSPNKKRLRKLDRRTLAGMGAFAEASNASVVNPSASGRRYDFSGLTYRIDPGGQRTVLSGQYFVIPKKCFVTVRYRGRVMQGDSSKLFLKHDLASNNGKMRIVEYVHAEACPGDTFSTDYGFYTGEGYYFTEFRATAEVMRGGPARIMLDEASLSFVRRPPTAAERKKYLRPFDKSIGRKLGASLEIRRGH